MISLLIPCFSLFRFRDEFFKTLRALGDKGVSIVLITHKLKEVIDVTDHAGGSNPYYQPAKGGGAAPK